jgi:hypothetical protein
MYKQAGKFVARSGIRASAVGLGAKYTPRVRVRHPRGIDIERWKGKLRSWGCPPNVIARFEKRARNERKVLAAVRLTIKETMPWVYHAIQRLAGEKPGWNFLGRFKEYRRQYPHSWIVAPSSTPRTRNTSRS